MDFSLSDSKRRTKKDSIIRTKRQGLQVEPRLQVLQVPPIILSKSQPRTGHTRRYYPYLHSCELTLHTEPEFIGKDPALRYVM